MRIDWTPAAICGLALLLVGIFPCVLVAQEQADAKSAFETLFAAKVRAVTMTTDRADDVALAREMVSVAKTGKDQPALLALLCDTAHDLAIRTPEGYGTAAEAMTLLADTIEAQREAAQSKLVLVLGRQSAAGPVQERDQAGQALVELLATMGDEKFQANKHVEAIADYRRAVTMAQQRKSPSLEKVKAKLDFAVSRDQTMKQLSRLQERLLKDATDQATAQEIVRLYVVEIDEPQSATAYLSRTKNEEMEALVPLAVKPVESLSGEDSLKLAHWYRKLAGTKPTHAVASKVNALLTRYLEVETNEGLSRVTAKTLIKEAQAQMATLPAAPGSGKLQRWVDLLKLVDMSKDVLRGGWTMDKDGLTLTKPERHSKVVVPVIPEGSYDLQSVFSFERSGLGPTIMLSTNGSTQQFGVMFDCALDKHWTGIWHIKDMKIEEQLSSGALRSMALKPEQKYTVDVAVRLLPQGKASVAVDLNGKELVRWQGLESDLTSESPRHFPNRTLGLIGWTHGVAYHSVRLKMVTGKLRMLREQ